MGSLSILLLPQLTTRGTHIEGMPPCPLAPSSLCSDSFVWRQTIRRGEQAEKPPEYCLISRRILPRILRTLGLFRKGFHPRTRRQSRKVCSTASIRPLSFTHSSPSARGGRRMIRCKILSLMSNSLCSYVGNTLKKGTFVSRCHLFSERKSEDEVCQV